jgi:hypothetical protein
MRMDGGLLAAGAVVLLSMCIAPSPARARNLDSGTPCDKEPPWGLDPTFTPADSQTGFACTFDHHRLTVSQTSPTTSDPSNFELLLARKTTITGNFVASVVVTRQAISSAPIRPYGQMGLLVTGAGPVPLIDLVLDSNGAISSTLWNENSIGQSTSVTGPRATVRLNICRKDNVLSVSYDGETKKFPSSPGNAFYGGPVTIKIMFNVPRPFVSEPVGGTFKRFDVRSAGLGDKCPSLPIATHG